MMLLVQQCVRKQTVSLRKEAIQTRVLWSENINPFSPHSKQAFLSWVLYPKIDKPCLPPHTLHMIQSEWLQINVSDITAGVEWWEVGISTCISFIVNPSFLRSFFQNILKMKRSVSKDVMHQFLCVSTHDLWEIFGVLWFICMWLTVWCEVYINCLRELLRLEELLLKDHKETQKKFKVWLVFRYVIDGVNLTVHLKRY